MSTREQLIANYYASLRQSPVPVLQGDITAGVTNPLTGQKVSTSLRPPERQVPQPPTIIETQTAREPQTTMITQPLVREPERIMITKASSFPWIWVLLGGLVLLGVVLIRR